MRTLLLGLALILIVIFAGCCDAQMGGCSCSGTLDTDDSSELRVNEPTE